MLKVPWVNEILLLKPASPESPPEDLKYGSHISVVVTIYMAGVNKEEDKAKKDIPWQISIFQRGTVPKDSLDVDFCYESLTKKAKNGTSEGFYNELLSLIPDMRRIRPSERERYVRLFLKEIEDEYNIKAMKLSKNKGEEEGYIKLESNPELPYSRFDIFGKGIEKRIIRFSYRTNVALDEKIREGNEYIYNGYKFYAYESFKVDSPAAVLRKIEENLTDKDLTEWKRHMQERKPSKITQDFIIVGQPNGFEYNMVEGATHHMHHRIKYVEWKNPGEGFKQSYTRAHIFFPREEFYSIEDWFALNFTARILCRMCEPYYIGAKIKEKVKEEIISEIEKRIKRFKRNFGK
jgi:hypothetical protein